MRWKQLNTESQLTDITAASDVKTQVIFKHSTRCPVSTMAKNRLEKNAFPEHADFYYLDLIAHRDISNKVASLFNVWHESPQVLVIKKGACIYDESHGGIQLEELLSVI